MDRASVKRERNLQIILAQKSYRDEAGMETYEDEGIILECTFKK